MAVCAVLYNDQGQILGISRRGEPNNMNLPGGKMESSDLNPEIACQREIWEETGVEMENLKLVFTAVCRGVGTPYITHCYTGTFKGTPVTKDEGDVRWISEDELLVDTNSFADYNRKLFKALKGK